MVAEKDFKGIVFDIKNIENNILFDCLTCDSFLCQEKDKKTEYYKLTLKINNTNNDLIKMRYSNIKLIDIEGVQYSPISIGYRCKQLNISQDCNPIELMPKSSANAVLIYQQARPDIVIERVAYHDFVYLNGTLGYKGYITINLLNGETLTNADKETISREKRKVTNEEDLNSINDEDNYDLEDYSRIDFMNLRRIINNIEQKNRKLFSLRLGEKQSAKFNFNGIHSLYSEFLYSGFLSGYNWNFDFVIDHDNNTLESFEFILDKKVFACKIADKGKTIMNCIIEAVSIFEEWFNNATNEDRIKIVGRISDEIDFKLIEGNTSVCRITSKRTRYKYELIIGNECNISELLSVLKLYDRKLIPRMLLYYVAGVLSFQRIVETLDNLNLSFEFDIKFPYIFKDSSSGLEVLEYMNEYYIIAAPKIGNDSLNDKVVYSINRGSHINKRNQIYKDIIGWIRKRDTENT